MRIGRASENTAYGSTVLASGPDFFGSLQNFTRCVRKSYEFRAVWWCFHDTELRNLLVVLWANINRRDVNVVLVVVEEHSECRNISE